MSEFRPGQKVRCVNDGQIHGYEAPELLAGEVYTVDLAPLSYEGLDVWIKETGEGYFRQRFEAVRKPRRKPFQRVDAGPKTL